MGAPFSMVKLFFRDQLRLYKTIQGSDLLAERGGGGRTFQPHHWFLSFTKEENLKRANATSKKLAIYNPQKIFVDKMEKATK